MGDADRSTQRRTQLAEQAVKGVVEQSKQDDLHQRNSLRYTENIR